MEPYRYVIWLVIVSTPFVLLSIYFWKLLKPFAKVGLLFNLIFVLPAILWDYAAIRSGVWHFVPPFIIRPHIFSYFPVEEFFLILLFSWVIMVSTVILGCLLKEI